MPKQHSPFLPTFFFFLFLLLLLGDQKCNSTSNTNFKTKNTKIKQSNQNQKLIPRFAHNIPLHNNNAKNHPPTNCQVLHHIQPIDHFDPSNTQTFSQRYFLNDDHFQDKEEGPIFFYLGNEADVTLYVNATGLMWEHASSFGALIVFAEHRYYGESRLFSGEEKEENLKYLTVEQALMDYVQLIHHIKTRYYSSSTSSDKNAAVIGFGGSYGGMLASWARFRYPDVWDGVIAASAPIVTFEGMGRGVVKDNYYSEGVTFDVTMDAGVENEYCEVNLRKLFAGKGLVGLKDQDLIRKAFRLCPSQDDDDHDDEEEDLGWQATLWINEALSYMSMGNFPYRSSYILNGDGTLPPFPVRVACQHLSKNMTHPSLLQEYMQGLSAFADVYYNYTGKLSCNSFSSPVNNQSAVVNHLWNYQYCTQIFQIFAQHTSQHDMYWESPWDGNATARACLDQYGIQTDRFHFAEEFGSPKDWPLRYSNVVWSQGEYDPWRLGGVVESLSDSLVAIVIEGAAHHLDLFFSNEDDGLSVKEARELEMFHVRKWIEEKRKRKRRRSDGGGGMLVGGEGEAAFVS